LLARWTATVSKTVSHEADAKTIRRHWLELAETSPQRAITHAVETGLVTRFEQSSGRRLGFGLEPLLKENAESAFITNNKRKIL
jgi:hypothetical protein